MHTIDKIDSVNTNVLAKFASNLPQMNTPSNIISFICEKNIKRSRKIHVQLTSITRRKDRSVDWKNQR